MTEEEFEAQAEAMEQAMRASYDALHGEGAYDKDQEAMAEWEEELAQQCGTSLIMGSGHDPYGTACDRKAEDHPRDERGRLLHSGPHPIEEGARLQWTGGGYCVGDPLPYTIISEGS